MLNQWRYTVKDWGKIVKDEDTDVLVKRDQLVQLLRQSKWFKDQQEMSALGKAVADLSDGQAEADCGDALDRIYDLADEQRVWLDFD